MSRQFYRRYIVALSIVATFGLAACGSGLNSGPTNASPGGTDG